MKQVLFQIKEFVFRQLTCRLLNKVDECDIIPPSAQEEIKFIEDDFCMGYITWSEMYHQVKDTLNKCYVNI